MSHDTLDTSPTPKRKPLSALGQLGILVALLSCVSAMSLTIVPPTAMPTKEEFNHLDSDNDGEVSRHEFIERYLKLDEPIIRSSLDPLDLQRATTEEAEELMRKASSSHEKVIEKVFDALDKNDDGVLTPKEYMSQRTLTKFQTWILDTTFESLDADGNEVVSQDEFVAAMEQHFKSDFSKFDFDKLESEFDRQKLASFMKQRMIEEHRRIDSNGDALLTLNEIESAQNWLKKIGYDTSNIRSIEEHPKNDTNAPGY